MPKAVNQSVINIALSYSYLNWYNSRPYPFWVHFTPYRNCEDASFARWLECNTPFSEYVLSYVFRIFDHIFLIYFMYLLCFMNIYAIVLHWIWIRGLGVSPSLNRGPDPKVLLNLVFSVFRFG